MESPQTPSPTRSGSKRQQSPSSPPTLRRKSGKLRSPSPSPTHLGSRARSLSPIQQEQSPVTPPPRVANQPPGAPGRPRRQNQNDFGSIRSLLQDFEDASRQEEIDESAESAELAESDDEVHTVPEWEIVLSSPISYTWFYGEEEMPESDDDEDDF